MATRVPRKFDDLIDVDLTGVADGDVPTYDAGTETWVPGTAGGADTDDQTAAEVPFTPAGNLSATDVQAALAELDTEKQPNDADLTAIAALSTTAFGRGLLTLANQAALLAAAGAADAVHVHAGEDITTGTVADARIASTIARDSEVTSAISAAIATHEGASDPHPTYTTAAELAAFAQPLDSDLTAIAALTTTSFGRSLLTLADAAALLSAAGAQASDSDLTAIAALTPTNDDVIQRKAGAWTNRSLAQLISDLAALGTTFQPLDADLTALAALATNAAGRSILILTDPNADRIAFWDDSAGTITWLSLGSGLTITGTTIAADGGGSFANQFMLMGA